MHKERLLKLADHLEHGQLGHAVFDFSVINACTDTVFAPGVCGTNGCAMGELPIVFPEDWSFMGKGSIWPTNTEEPFNGGDYDRKVTAYFGITMADLGFLFMPGVGFLGCGAAVDQTRLGEIDYFESYGAWRLPSTATKEAVARHIHHFVWHTEAGLRG